MVWKKWYCKSNFFLKLLSLRWRHTCLSTCDVAYRHIFLDVYIQIISGPFQLFYSAIKEAKWLHACTWWHQPGMPSSSPIIHLNLGTLGSSAPVELRGGDGSRTATSKHRKPIGFQRLPIGRSSRPSPPWVNVPTFKPVERCISGKNNRDAGYWFSGIWTGLFREGLFFPFPECWMEPDVNSMILWAWRVNPGPRLGIAPLRFETWNTQRPYREAKKERSTPGCY